MKRSGILVLACALVIACANVGFAFDSHVELPVLEFGEQIIPVVDCVEYSQRWVGSFGPITDAFVWDTRVGLHITNQYPGPGPGPGTGLAGYGFTYGTGTLKNEYWDGETRPLMEAFVWAVEDPTDDYDGYYGRVWGYTPEWQGAPAQAFEATIKFTEEGNVLEGEVVLIRNVGGEGTYECYGEPLPLKAVMEGGQSVKYQETTPLALYDDQTLAGIVSGTMNGDVALAVDSVRLGTTPNPLTGQAWAFLKEGDGFSVGEAKTPEEVGVGRTWLVIQRDPEVENIDNYDGMFQAYEGEGSGKMPAFTVDGDFSFATGVFTGVTEQLINLPGDLNGDGTVNSSDLDIVRANWGARPLSGEFLMGDCSRNAHVTSGDLDLVRANWGATAAASVVPEPGTLALLFGLVLLGLGVRRP